MIVQLQAAPGQRRSVMEICQSPKIQQLKKNALNRFTSWVSDDSAHLFSLEKDGMGPKKGDAVVLIGDPVECDRIIFEYADLDSNYMEMFPQLGTQVERSDKPTKIRKIGGGGNGSLF
ncbi:unnamed protein product [Amoebophrya sp. A25]|nr:unnamed protein product [Amoebophrya sp. A25]|eukprot:GSA25T00027890001.1